MNLVLERNPSNQFCTIGTLYVNGVFECWTLEDVVREQKIPGETAIPAGTYQVIVDWSPHFKTFLPRLLNVPNFAGVRIHPGNVAADTQGCILVGKYKDENTVISSREAFSILFPKISAASNQGEKVTLRIENVKESDPA